MRVDRVGLAALAGGEHSGSGGQLRRHVKNGFAVGDQALGDVPTDTGAAFDRPDAVGVLTAGGEHRLVSVAIGAEAALADGLLAVVQLGTLDSNPSRVALSCEYAEFAGLASTARRALTTQGGQR